MLSKVDKNDISKINHAISTLGQINEDFFYVLVRAVLIEAARVGREVNAFLTWSFEQLAF